MAEYCLFRRASIDEKYDFTHVPLTALNTETACAADYVAFMQSVIGELYGCTDDLEVEANKTGRTIRHPFFGGFGSAELDYLNKGSEDVVDAAPVVPADDVGGVGVVNVDV